MYCTFFLAVTYHFQGRQSQHRVICHCYGIHSACRKTTYATDIDMEAFRLLTVQLSGKITLYSFRVLLTLIFFVRLLVEIYFFSCCGTQIYILNNYMFVIFYPNRPNIYSRK